jgi:glycerophosphoryl diester phosphodiesterase
MPQLLDRFKRLDRRPLVLGHRGARREAPENTLLAFELARKQGADGVELDVQSSADGVPFVVHDLDLARVTDGRIAAKVRDLTALALDEVDLGSEQRPPRLEAVLDWAEQRSMLLNVELKTASARTDGIAETVANLLLARPEVAVLVSSFHPTLLRRFKAAAPHVPTGFLFTYAHQRWARLAGVLKASAVHPDALCFQQSADNHGAWARPSAMLVNTWTVNDETQARTLADRGVDAIITDVPGAILRALSPSLLEAATPTESEEVAEIA